MLVEQIERSSPVCGLIHETAEKCRIAIPPQSNGPPHARRCRRSIRRPNITRCSSDFRRRLEAIVSSAERVGALPVLIMPAANDAGFEPSRSFLPATTRTRPARVVPSENSWPRAAARNRSPRRRHHALSLAARSLSWLCRDALSPGPAARAEGAWDEAYHHYVSARDRDGYPMRCLSAFQEVYREVASRHDCILIDSQSYFHAIGRHGLLDDELFQDAMHPSLRGQIALAQAVAQALHARRAFGWPKESPIPVIDPGECAAHFGLGPAAWRVICLWGIKFNGLAAPLTVRSEPPPGSTRRRTPWPPTESPPAMLRNPSACPTSESRRPSPRSRENLGGRAPTPCPFAREKT